MKYKNIAAAWIKQTKKGDDYLFFKADVDIKAGESISLWLNDKGDNPKRPDYRAYEKEEEVSKGDDVADDIPF